MPSDRTSSAELPSAPIARAVTGMTRRTVIGAGPASPGRSRDRAAVLAGHEQREPRSEQIERGALSSQAWAMRPPMSTLTSVSTGRIDPPGSAERAAVYSTTGRRSAS